MDWRDRFARYRDEIEAFAAGFDADGVERWDEFMSAVEARLEAGAREYGGQSAYRTGREIALEQAAEAADLVGWGVWDESNPWSDIDAVEAFRIWLRCMRRAEGE